MILTTFRRKRRARLRQQMRGSQRLINARDPFRGHCIANNLIEVDLMPNTKCLYHLNDPKLMQAAKNLLTQKILAILGLNELLPGILQFAGNQKPITIALPQRWRAALKDQGYATAPFFSAVKWWVWVIKTLLRGTARATIRLVWSATGKLNSAPAQNYAVLCNLPNNAVPTHGDPQQSFTLLGWYLRQTERPTTEILWAHILTQPRIPNKSQNPVIVYDFFPQLSGIWQHVKAAINIVTNTVSAISMCFVGQWQLAILLEDILSLAYMKQLPRRAIARHYLFNNGSIIHKPLWASWAEENAGARVDLVFYSGNCELYAPDCNYEGTPAIGYPAATWEGYYVWDIHQEEFLRACGLTTPAKICGPIDFIDDGTHIEIPPGLTLSVFDVVPYRPAFLAAKGIVFPYYSGNRTANFLIEVAEELAARNITMALKTKRSINQHTHPAYQATLDRLSEMPNVIIISSDIAARRLIKQTDGVISLPFTSTAIIGLTEKLPSIYFDPDGKLSSHPRLDHGIPTIKGRQALQNWLDATFDNKKPISILENHRCQ